MKNLQLDIDRLIKEKNDLKNELDAHLEKQLDLPTEEDFNNLEDENTKLRKQVAQKNLKIDYNNSNEVVNYISGELVFQIRQEVQSLLDDYGDECEENDALFEIIDSLGDVVYNYQARKIVDAFGYDAFGYSEMNGERYNSYNEIAFDIIYSTYCKKYH
tara:strand:- start:203 stop:679 length:477 start_codon:yes stop_codon:yes gene_type:complete